MRRCVLVVLAVVLGCATAPYTGRHQFMVVSAEEEAKLGTQAYREVLQTSRIDHDAGPNRAVDEVGRRIARVVNRPDFDWRFTVIDDPKQQNAFALPGGKVAVYTGIFPIAETTAGLAVVMGHEISHVLARHGAERMSQGALANLGGAVFGAATGVNPVLVAYGLEYGVLRPWSRTQESEADHIGLIVMAKAGYDPRAAVAFWQRMEAATKSGQPPEFLSTHPSHEARVRDIESWLPEALPYYERAGAAPVEPLPPA